MAKVGSNWLYLEGEITCTTSEVLKTLRVRSDWLHVDGAMLCIRPQRCSIKSCEKWDLIAYVEGDIVPNLGASYESPMDIGIQYAMWRDAILRIRLQRCPETLREGSNSLSGGCQCYMRPQRYAKVLSRVGSNGL